MREDILDRTTVENIIDLLQMDLEVNNEKTDNYNQIRQWQLADIGETLSGKLPQQESGAILNDIQDFESIVAEEHLRIGFKAGVKLMNELGKI